MSANANVDPFRLLLYNLSEELLPKDVDALKYLAGIGDAVAEECDSGLDVFKALMRLGKIAPDNVDFLTELFKSVKRLDLISLVGMVNRTFY